MKSKYLLIRGELEYECTLEDAASMLKMSPMMVYSYYHLGYFDERVDGYRGYHIKKISSLPIRRKTPVYVYSSDGKYFGKEISIQAASDKFNIARNTIKKYLDSGKEINGYKVFSKFQK